MSYYSGHPDQYFGQNSYSQHGEDLVILNIFKQLGIEKPSYLDLGAHHPSRISNTKLLYERGSRGVNVEPNKLLIEEFELQRPLDKNVNVAVGVKEGEAIFFKYDNWSGRNTLSMKEVELVGKTEGMRIQSHEIVKTKTVDQIVSEYCDGHFPEFLNCDLEGMDFEILSQADFKSSSPVVICVEVMRSRQEILTMLAEKNFYAYIALGENILFVRDFYLYTLKKGWPRVNGFKSSQ